MPRQREGRSAKLPDFRSGVKYDLCCTMLVGGKHGAAVVYIWRSYMKHKNIFSLQNQTILKFFEQAGHPRKVLCIVLDYAKLTHTAFCCNGTGKALKNPFPVKNNPAGLKFLLETVGTLFRKHQIGREHVFFGGEDCGTLTLNMIYSLP